MNSDVFIKIRFKTTAEGGRKTNLKRKLPPKGIDFYAFALNNPFINKDPYSILNGMTSTFVDGGIPTWVIPDQRMEGLLPEIMTWMSVPK